VPASPAPVTQSGTPMSIESKAPPPGGPTTNTIPPSAPSPQKLIPQGQDAPQLPPGGTKAQEESQPQKK
jgi:hypothetical protein